ncbi:methylornithine synthase PylB [uncultured Anaeromusa sp.]|uniref:methylornithine synthase PylB n=1 Tax=uncultured Anaeromusa sp. TaxID=673273 RepID=UPI0029C6B38A|nr:methylornithine synthase PylB [uncultured Anaeromusa sp.]
MEMLKTILVKALRKASLSKHEIAYLLQRRLPEEKELLYQAARMARQEVFGQKVFLYGFVYFSTFCRNDCAFCLYRKSQKQCLRYRKSDDEVVRIAQALAQSGVHLIDLTMGEDPHYVSSGRAGHKALVQLVRRVKTEAGLPVMISPGLVPKDVLLELKKAGADWYACYQETHNRELFGKLRLEQDYDARWEAKVFAKAAGLLVEEGLLTGVGDTSLDAVQSLSEMKRLGADQVRTMTFVPQKGTPLEALSTPDREVELNLIAVMRLLFRASLIPASLDVEGIEGLRARLQAGANVVTSIIPPEAGLAGVSQETLDIEEGYRTVQGVAPVLASCGLTAATAAEYQAWLQQRQESGSVREAIL